MTHSMENDDVMMQRSRLSLLINDINEETLISIVKQDGKYVTIIIIAISLSLLQNDIINSIKN